MGVPPAVMAVSVDAGLSADGAVTDGTTSASLSRIWTWWREGTASAPGTRVQGPLSEGPGPHPELPQRFGRPGLAAPRPRSQARVAGRRPPSGAPCALANKEGCADHTRGPRPKTSRRSPRYRNGAPRLTGAEGAVGEELCCTF